MKKENPMVMPRGAESCFTMGVAMAIATIATACVVDDVVVTRDGGPDADIDLGGCQVDSSKGPLNALALAPADGTNTWEATGYICPVGDTDWYLLSLPDEHRLARVAVTMRGPMSPVLPAVTVLTCDELCLVEHPDEEPPRCCTIEAAWDHSSSEEALEQVLCLESSIDHYIVLSDVGDDNADVRYPRGEYVLTVDTSEDSDTNESNDDQTHATHLRTIADQRWGGGGQINCRGDQDWFVLDESDGANFDDGGTLSVTLDISRPVLFQPQLRVYNAAQVTLGAINNPEATEEITHLEWSYSIEAPNAYYFVVDDYDRTAIDSAPYELTVTITP